MDGKDLLPLLRGETKAVRSSLVLAVNNSLFANGTDQLASAFIEGDLKLILGSSLVSE